MVSTLGPLRIETVDVGTGKAWRLKSRTRPPGRGLRRLPQPAAFIGIHHPQSP